MDFTKYQNTMTYPKMPNASMGVGKAYSQSVDEYGRNMRKYRTHSKELEIQFMVDAFEELGITDNPKKHKLFGLAWEYGHSSGMSEVWLYMQDLVELIKEN